MIETIVIRPMVGIEGLMLGMSMEEVVEVLGEPNKRSNLPIDEDHPDETWHYYHIGINLTFYADADRRLGDIVVENSEAELAGYRFIGMEEQVFLATIGQTEIGPLVLEDDFTELGSKCYVSDPFGLFFWVHEGMLESITIFPDYDESGEIPQWPGG